MGQARFVECGEILQRDFAKGFSVQRFVPGFAVNGERLVVMALEKQGVGEVPWMKIKLSWSLFWIPSPTISLASL